MDNYFGPRDRNELTENEELEILEAYQSADEFIFVFRAKYNPE